MTAASKQESAKTATYDPKTNRLTSLVDAQGRPESFTYDDQGNLATRTTHCGTTIYTWNVKQQLTAIAGFKANCSTVSASFVYDALSRRIQKTVNGETTTYLYDGLDVIAEIGSNTATYLRTNSIDEAIARYSANDDRYLLTDMLGSTVALADRASSAPVTTYGYSPFGEAEQGGQVSDNPTQYTGRENDGTGLYYYRARYYAPDFFRFVSADPIGLAGGLNEYAYVHNSPTGWIDPLGWDGKAASNKASSLIGNADYGFLDPHPESRGRLASLLGGRKSNKCNSFVWDVLNAGGDPPGRMPDGRIPSAEEWANPNVYIPGYVVLPSGSSYQAGDIIATGGHVGVYYPLPGGLPGTISAKASLGGEVVHNDWGFRPGQSPVARRCSCDMNVFDP
jgi:RHS repeat-associated protein